MTEPYLKKIQRDPEGLDFEGLREEGIRLVQALSGDIWTDYNLHDPGVTILEALCYALTDLMYRSGFAVADFLAQRGGGIDFKKEGLFLPDEIFPCRPVTADDYRKLILNSVPNMDNLWVERHKDESGTWDGLYEINVQLAERVKDHENEGVRKAYRDLVEKSYAANRNLCEDLHAVRFVERIPYSLRGDIEVDGRRGAAEILAEIYFEFAQYLSPKVPIRSYMEMRDKGIDLENLLSGVLTANGYIADDELYPWRGDFSIPDMVGKIAGIEGIKNIKSLVFVDGKGEESDSISLGGELSGSYSACLKFPPTGEDIKLYRAGKAYKASIRDIEIEFARLDYKHQALRQKRQSFDWISAMMPKADFRNIGEYFSIQNHFPDVYGLNSYGVPDSASPERKAQAMQLKAYLLFFEQIMANFLKNLQEIPRFFSLDEELKQSYFSSVLQSDSVPNVEEVYLEDISQIGQKLASLLASFDNYEDRRNRVLDYLLALYGEKFSQNSLQQFFSHETDPDDARIKNKIAFLKEIAELNRNRAAAFDYRKPKNGGSGFKKKLEVLLGLPRGAPEEFEIVEHILLRPKGSHAEPSAPDDFYSFRISIIFSARAGNFADSEFRKLVLETLYLNCPAHIHPELYWLEPKDWQRFKSLHEKWLEEKRSPNSKDHTLDAAARGLMLFLREIALDK